MTGREMHRAYTREIERRMRAAVLEACGQKLRIADIDAFYEGAVHNGGERWHRRGQQRALYHRLEAAGLLEGGSGWAVFGIAWSEATVTPKGRHALWLLVQAHEQTAPMLRAALRQQAEERRAAAGGQP